VRIRLNPLRGWPRAPSPDPVGASEWTPARRKLTTETRKVLGPAEGAKQRAAVRVDPACERSDPLMHFHPLILGTVRRFRP